MSYFVHNKKQHAKEVVELVVQSRQVQFDVDLVDAIVSQTDGYVFKDIEKLVDKLLLNNWNDDDDDNGDAEANSVTVQLNQSTRAILYNYTCLNLAESRLYKANSQLSWSAVGGLSAVKRSLIESLVWPVKYKELYRRFSMKQSAGVLLYGPSGCGKTAIASALASESQFNFISVKGPELLSKYIGNSEQNVRALFAKAEKARPCIVFFDEFDALAPRRGHDSTGVTDRVVNQLLTQLDGVEQLDGVYLLAATSRPDMIDQALLRPGRLDSFLYVAYPDQIERKEILAIYCQSMRLANDVDMEELSDMCVDLSGADIKAVVCDALVNAFHRAHGELVHSEAFIGADTDVNAPRRRAVAAAAHQQQQQLRDNIVLNRYDLVSSIDSIKKSINLAERNKAKRFFENWALKGSTSEKSVVNKHVQRATLA